MSNLPRLAFLMSLVSVSTYCSSVFAQPEGPPPIPPDVRVEPLSGGLVARLVVTWGESDEECSTVLTLGNDEPIRLSEPPRARDHGALDRNSAIVLESRGGALRPRGVSLD